MVKQYQFYKIDFHEVYKQLKSMESFKITKEDAQQFTFNNGNQNQFLFKDLTSNERTNFKTYAYREVVDSLMDKSDKATPYYDMRVKLSMRNPKTGLPYYMTNSSLYLTPIFIVGINDNELISYDKVPENGLFIAFYNGPVKPVSELSQVFWTGWTYTGLKKDENGKLLKDKDGEPIREGKLEIAKQLTLEKFDDGSTHVSNNVRPPLFCLEMLDHVIAIRDQKKLNQVALLTAEFFYHELIKDKLKFLMSVYKTGQIDASLFIEMKNSFLKYYEVLGSNPQYNKKVLNRIVLFPLNVQRINNPNYFDETSDAMDVRPLIGDNTPEGRKIMWRNLKNTNHRLKYSELYNSSNEIPRENLAGRYRWNWWSPEYLRTTFDHLISEKIDFHKMDFDRMTQNYGFQLISNSDASRMKGTHVVVNKEIVEELLKIDPERRRFIDNYPDTYADVFLGKLFSDSNQFLSLYPSKVEGDKEKTIANTKKNQVRQHSLISGNYLKVANENLKKNYKVERFEENTWKEMPEGILDRSKIYLHHDPTAIGKTSNCQVNVYTAFLPSNPKFVGLSYDDFLKLNDQEFEEFVRSLEGVDCKAKISSDIGNISIIRNKKIPLNVYKCNYSWILKHILKQIDENEFFVMDFNQVVEIEGERITPNKLRLTNELRCTEPTCGALIVPAYEEAVDDFGTEYEYNLDYNQDIMSYKGDFCCPACGAAYEYDNESIQENVYSPREFKQYDLNKIAFCGYETTDEGIILYVDLHVPWGQSRTIDELTKALPLPTGQDFLGEVQQEFYHPETGELYRITAPLDMNHYPGANKAKLNGIAVAYLRTLNAVFGTNYCPDGEIKELAQKKIKEDIRLLAIDQQKSPQTAKAMMESIYAEAIKEIEEKYNEILRKSIKPAIWTGKIVNPKTKQIETITRQVYAALVNISPSEVSDEFNKTRLAEDSALLTFRHVDFCNNLGLEDLINSVYESRTKGHSEEEYRNIEEYLKIVHSDFDKGVYLEPSPVVHDIAFIQTNGRVGNLFHTQDKNRVDINNLMTWEDFQKLVHHHKLLKISEEPFTYEKVTFDPNTGETNTLQESVDYAKGITVAVPVKEYTDTGETQVILRPLRFPSRKTLISRVTPMKNYVRIPDECKEALKMFYNLGSIGKSMADYVVNQKRFYANQGKIVSDFFLLEEAKKQNDCSISVKQYHRYKRKFKDPIERKKADIHEITAMSLPCYTGKVVGSELIPVGTVVVPNKMDRKMKKSFFKTLHKRGEITQEHMQSMISDPKMMLQYILYGISNRDPNIMEMQEAGGIVQIWSVSKANNYFKDNYGISFHEVYPKFSGLMKNMTDLVMFQQADADGDYDREAIPFSIESQNQLKRFHSTMKNYNALRNADDNSSMYELKQIQLPWAYKYLQEEYLDATLNYAIDNPVQLNVAYNIIDSDYVNNSLHQNTQAKGNIANLSSSMWDLDIYTEYLVSIGKLTSRERKYIQYFYQMVFVQDGCIRALKGSGELGFCTLDNIAINKKILLTHVDGTEEEVHVRDLVRRYASKFEEDYGISTFKDILEETFFETVCDSWARIAGFIDVPEEDTSKLGNNKIKNNASMEPIAKLIKTIKKIAYATSSSFQKDEFGLYENLTLKNQDNEFVISKMKSFKMFERLFSIVQKINRRGE